MGKGAKPHQIQLYLEGSKVPHDFAVTVHVYTVHDNMHESTTSGHAHVHRRGVHAYIFAVLLHTRPHRYSCIPDRWVVLP